MSVPKVAKIQCKTVGRRCINIRKNIEIEQDEISQDADDEQDPKDKDTFLGDLDLDTKVENNVVEKDPFLEDLELHLKQIESEKDSEAKDTFLDVRNSKDVRNKDITLDIRRDKVSLNRGGQFECNTEESKSYPCIYVTSLKPSINEKVRSSNDENIIQSQVENNIHYKNCTLKRY